MTRNWILTCSFFFAVEEREHKIEGLRNALLDGERSGDVGELDRRKIKSKARRGAKSAS